MTELLVAAVSSICSFAILVALGGLGVFLKTRHDRKCAVSRMSIGWWRRPGGVLSVAGQPRPRNRRSTIYSFQTFPLSPDPFARSMMWVRIPQRTLDRLSAGLGYGVGIREVDIESVCSSPTSFGPPGSQISSHVPLHSKEARYEKKKTQIRDSLSVRRSVAAKQSKAASGSPNPEADDEPKATTRAEAKRKSIFRLGRRDSYWIESPPFPVPKSPLRPLPQLPYHGSTSAKRKSQRIIEGLISTSRPLTPIQLSPLLSATRPLPPLPASYSEDLKPKPRKLPPIPTTSLPSSVHVPFRENSTATTHMPSAIVRRLSAEATQSLHSASGNHASTTSPNTWGDGLMNELSV